MFMWGVAESLAGWAPARFGLFGLNKEPVASPGLNYAGAALTLGSLILLVFAQPNPSATITTAPAASKGHGAGAPEAADPEGSSVDALQLQSPGRPLPVGAIESGSSSTLVADSEFEGSSSSSSEPELRRRLLALEAGQAAIGAAVVPGDDRCHPMTAVSASGTINARALPSSSSAAVSAAEPAAEGEGKWTDRLSPVQRRVFGAVACVIAGSLSGSTFTPVQHIVDATTNYAASGGPAQDAPFPGASTDLLDHLFAHHCGILAASIAYFLVYLAVCGARGRAPAVHGEEISKYMASGVIWGIAMVSHRRDPTHCSAVLSHQAKQIGPRRLLLQASCPASVLPSLSPSPPLLLQLCWFLANANLSIVVAFPLVTLGPGLVSVAWGVVVWRELSGWRNIALVAAATAVYLAGAICIVASKQS